MFTKENILDEINKDLRKAYNGELFKIRLVLFQFFQLKYISKFKPNYIGYILYKNTLDVLEVGTLSNAKIFTEVKDIEVNDYYFELLGQFYSELNLKEKFTSILKSQNIQFPLDSSLYNLFLILKNNNENIFRQREYFHFRFFKLSDKYAPYESILWEALKEVYGWRLKYKLRRGL